MNQDTRSAKEYENNFVKSGSGKIIKIKKLLGSGAEGCVYNVRNTDNSGVPCKHNTTAVKIFREKRRDENQRRKIKEMVLSPPRDPTLELKNFHSIIWPSDIIYDIHTNEFVGYEMPYIDEGRSKNILDYSRIELKWDDSTWDDRCKVAINLASAVAVIHKQGHAIGDMNHDNILVKDGYISLIDCDSYHITKGNQEFSGKTYFHRYHPPEKRGKGIDEVQLADRFGLAIHIFQLLMSGFHPYQSKGLEVNKHEGFENKIKYTRFTYDNPVPKRSEPAPQAPPYNELPANVQSLFNKCFVLGKRDPDMRPSAEEWVRTLRHTHSHQRTGIIRVSHVRQWINLPRKSMLPNWSKLPRLRLLRLRLIDVIGILLVFLTMYMLYTLGIVE